MKKIVLLITILTSINNFSAKVIFTDEKTYTNEKDINNIVYKDKKHESPMDIFERQTLQINDYNNIINEEIMKKIFYSNLGILPKNNIKKRVYSNDTAIYNRGKGIDEHEAVSLKAMFLGSKFQKGNTKEDEYFLKRKMLDSFYVDFIRITTKNTPDGIYAFNNSYDQNNIMVSSKNSIYFGDVENEFLINQYTPKSLIDKNHTDNTQMFVMGSGNSSSKKLELKTDSNFKYGTYNQRGLANVFHMFGSNVHKKIRSEFVNIADIDINFYDKGKNKNNYIDLPFAFYNRANTIAIDSETYNDVNKEKEIGVSFSIPKAQGILYKLQHYFPNLTLHQAKQFLLTMGKNETLDNKNGFGEILPYRIQDVYNGPSAFNVGLIEEQKFFTGMYDKVYDSKNNRYFFYADVPDQVLWNFSNNIKGGLKNKPTGETCEYIYLKHNNLFRLSAHDDFSPKEDVFASENKYCFQNYLDSEYNFYENNYDTQTLAGLRKAGSGSLILMGDNLTYKGDTQVLEGILGIYGNMISSRVFSYENSVLYIGSKDFLANFKNKNIKNFGNVFIKELHVAGGKIFLDGNVTIDKLVIYDIPTPFGFLTNNKEAVKVEVGEVIGTRDKIEKIKDYINRKKMTVKKITIVEKAPEIDDIYINETKTFQNKKEFFFNDFKDTMLEEKQVKNLPSNKYIYATLVNRYGRLFFQNEKIKKVNPAYVNGEFLIENDKNVLKFNKSFDYDNFFANTLFYNLYLMDKPYMYKYIYDEDLTKTIKPRNIYNPERFLK